MEQAEWIGASSGYRIQISQGIPADPPEARFLFNQSKYLAGQTCGEPILFRVWRKNRMLAFIYLFLGDKVAFSPCRATFGSVECTAAVTAEALDLLLQQASSFASSRSLTSIRVISYPFCYDYEGSTWITAAFLRNGFSIQYADENYHIPVIEEKWELSLHPSARRRLEKCLAAGFTFGPESASYAGKAWHFINTCRKRRGFPITLDQDSFIRLLEGFPGVYQLFTVKDGANTAALTVTVRINEHILYNFYPADAEGYQTYSPSILLTKELYEYAGRQGFKLLDLGIATDQGRPNHGLIRFKRNLGALPSLKLTFLKLLP